MENKILEISPIINEITGEVIDAAMMVHKAMGPGLLENVYEACLVYELKKKGVKNRTTGSYSRCL